jgi:uncharacterized protein YxjI
VPDLPTTRFPNWYPDPTGRSSQRYFDGGRWTEHVFADGRQGTDPLPEERSTEGAGAAAPATPGSPVAAAAPSGPPTANRAARVVPLDDDPGAGHLRTARVLLVGLSDGHGVQEVHDQRDRLIGTIRVLLPATARLARLLVAGEPSSSCRVQVIDADGGVVVEVARPNHPLRVRMQVVDGNGRTLGTIVQHQVLTRMRYSLEIDGTALGSIDADRWDHSRIEMTDPAGNDLARITRTWEVLAGSRFTPADTYVVQLAPGLTDPARGLLLAAALSVDTALRPPPSGPA